MSYTFVSKFILHPFFPKRLQKLRNLKNFRGVNKVLRSENANDIYFFNIITSLFLLNFIYRK